MHSTIQTVTSACQDVACSKCWKPLLGQQQWKGSLPLYYTHRGLPHTTPIWMHCPICTNSPKSQIFHEQAAWTPSLWHMWAVATGVALAHPTGNHQLHKDCTRVAFSTGLPNGQRQAKSRLRSSSKSNRMSQGSLEIIRSHHSAQRRAACMGWSVRTCSAGSGCPQGWRLYSFPGYLAAAMTDHPCSNRALSCVKMSFPGSQFGPTVSPPVPETIEKRLDPSPLLFYQVFTCADEISLCLLTPGWAAPSLPRHSRTLTPFSKCVTGLQYGYASLESPAVQMCPSRVEQGEIHLPPTCWQRSAQSIPGCCSHPCQDMVTSHMELSAHQSVSAPRPVWTQWSYNTPFTSVPSTPVHICTPTARKSTRKQLTHPARGKPPEPHPFALSCHKTPPVWHLKGPFLGVRQAQSSGQIWIKKSA